MYWVLWDYNIGEMSVFTEKGKLTNFLKAVQDSLPNSVKYTEGEDYDIFQADVNPER